MQTLKLYSWGTPNGLKPLLMLEELGARYELVKVEIGKGAQKTPEFHAKNTNERIPVLETTIDGNVVAISESAAILVHLAETHGGRFLPVAPASRAMTFQWTFFQMSAVGPMFGQVGYWSRREPKNAEAIERYLVESKRIIGVLDERLSTARYLAGDEYTIADMATLFWVRRIDFFGLALATWPHVQRWVQELEERPAVKATLAVTWP
jgi:GST-like protein